MIFQKNQNFLKASLKKGEKFSNILNNIIIFQVKKVTFQGHLGKIWVHKRD